MTLAAAGFAPAARTPDVLFGRTGSLARVRLNRPQVINALTEPMVQAMLDQLRRWIDDDTVTGVLLDGAGPRGFCAGGDVRSLRDAILRGSDDPLRFWELEYQLDATIAAYPKPFWVLMHGVTMGGGLGLSAHAATRLVSPGARVAMPETAIGFFPDVGMCHLLARAPGELGTHLALTGEAIGPADAIHMGLADQMVDPADQVADLLAAGHVVPAPTAPDPPLAGVREWADECYAGADTAVILRRLQDHPDPAARSAAGTIATRSPFSVCVTLAALRRAKKLSLAQVFAQDTRLGRAFRTDPDFVEGVRAVLVDKDHTPRWRHASVGHVSPAEVAAAVDGPLR